MSVFKKLAGETALYGVSSILARMVNFILVPIHTEVFKNRGDYGVVGQLYAWIALGVVLYTFRMEASYFRYTSNDDKSSSYANAKVFTLITAIAFSIVVLLFSDQIAGWLDIEGYGHLVKYAAGIVALDAICELPFARLRLQKRPIKFVLIKFVNIVINLLLNVYFLLWRPRHGIADAQDLLVYVFVANLFASVVTLILLSKEYLFEGFSFNQAELKKILSYAWPLLIVALSAVINDAMTRQFLGWLSPGTLVDRQNAMGEYNACIKFAVFISLFVQAFRYAAEPFFFKHMHAADAKKDYSQITTYFTQFMMIGFVGVLLYLDFFKQYIVRTPAYLQAIGVVPIVLMANVFLGIYYNVSNWYRLTDRTRYGMYSAVIGVALTIVFNLILVPKYSYIGTAWAMLICYAGMTIVTYAWGQRFYPIPYELGKIVSVMIVGVSVYLIVSGMDRWLEPGLVAKFAIHTLWMLGFVVLFNWPLVKTVLARQNQT
ncbi:MAG: polysaccharide biosynthesis C-terminal domain-containing protein [Saprospiraceae bacterium]|nr:polysaccharide biosynthesis C-terminal domain-containing protein [Saprospiraceae bacterium]